MSTWKHANFCMLVFASYEIMYKSFLIELDELFAAEML